MAHEISGNSGYLALKVESTRGVAVTPDTYVPFYDETLTTDHQHDTNNSVFGSKAARHHVTPGIRAHGGDLEVMAEPNSTALFYDMLLTRDSVTGSGDPYTWAFKASFTAPKSYTIDISSGNQVFRFAGVQASEITPAFDKNEMRWKVKVAALKSFLGAEIASVSDDVVTLKAPVNYPAPTQCLVADDLVAVVSADGETRQNFTISELTSTTVKLSDTPSNVSEGDMLILRPATPDLSLADPFLWSRTEFRLAATASAALSAAHTPMEEGSEWTIMHPFDNDKGEPRSGSFDPAALARGGSVDVTPKLKKFFYSPDEVRNFIGLKKVACVIRCFSGSNHEFRLTLNNMTCTKGGDKPKIKVDTTEFYEMEYTPSYDESDGQMMDVKVINALSA